MTWCFLTNMRFIGELLVRIDKFNIEWLVPKSNRNIITYRLCHAQLVALWRVPAFQAVSATLKADRAPSRALARHSMAKKIFRRPKSHYTGTRLRFLDHKNFSVLFFFKPHRQTAPELAALRKTRTEKIEKNFSVFHFSGFISLPLPWLIIWFIWFFLFFCVSVNDW